MSLPRIAVLGSGAVARSMALGFHRFGYPLVLGNRDVTKLGPVAQELGVPALLIPEAIAAADVVVLTVKGTAAEAVVAAHRSQLAGRIVLDATNPIADLPPDQGVLRFFTTEGTSLMERLQALAPEARFVKAFNSVGHAHFVQPAFPQGKPSMFLAGNDGEAKQTVAAIIETFGWEPEDMGLAPSARPLEALCQLWCAPGFLRNQWNHAFHLLKA